MAEINSFSSGAVNISEEVIGVIGSIAASEIEGIHSLSGTFSEEVMEFIGKKSFQKGVKVELNNGVVLLEIGIVVDYGKQLIDISKEVQMAVKTAIESMTGIDVVAVNILIESVKIKTNSN